ncbi:MAG TPA: iron ABC transporter permease [Polyangiaceae bacterium]|nr:iron ABC transporter permease [Polyangiaceae bacterium]
MRKSLVFGLCGVGLVLATAAGLSLGSGSARGVDLFLPGSRAHAIVVDYRLPRVLLAELAGAGLAAVGAAFQSLLRNPLAEPYVLGVSGGAALGATLAIAFGLGGGLFAAAASVPAAAFVGGLAATALVWLLARSGRAGSASILLAGVVVNSIAGACMLFVEALAEPDKLQSLLWWLMGYLDAPAWPRLGFVAAYVAAGLGVLLADAARINVLSLGDETAASVGIDVRALERRTLLACAAVVGAIVSVTGLVGFVGLVVPQGMRRVVGPDLRILLPVSAFAGASVLVVCDTLVRMLAPVLHTEVPVGAITSLVGGPVFLVLLARARAN